MAAYIKLKLRIVIFNVQKSQKHNCAGFLAFCGATISGLICDLLWQKQEKMKDIWGLKFHYLNEKNKRKELSSDI